MTAPKKAPAAKAGSNAPKGPKPKTAGGKNKGKAYTSTLPSTSPTTTVVSDESVGMSEHNRLLIIIAVIVVLLLLFGGYTYYTWSHILASQPTPSAQVSGSGQVKPVSLNTVPPLPPQRVNVGDWKGAIAAMAVFPEIRERLNQIWGKTYVDAELARLPYDQENGVSHVWAAPQAGIPFVDTDYGSNLEDFIWTPFQNSTTLNQEFLTWTDGRPALRVGCLNAVDFTQPKQPAAKPRTPTKTKTKTKTHNHKPPPPPPPPPPATCTNGTPGTGLTSPGTPGNPTYR